MEYEIRNYSSYDDDPRFVVRSDTGNISNISDRMVRLAAKITEIYAGDIFYDIDTLNRVVESGKNHAWLLCLREDGTCLHDISFHRNELDGIEFDNFVVPFPVSWTVKMKKKQKETQDILSYHTQAAGCSDKARAKASGGRQPIEECGRTGL